MSKNQEREIAGLKRLMRWASRQIHSVYCECEAEEGMNRTTLALRYIESVIDKDVPGR